jgi:hypothetical protein
MYSLVLMSQIKRPNRNQVKQIGASGSLWAGAQDFSTLFVLVALIASSPSFWSIIALILRTDPQFLQSAVVVTFIKSSIWSIGLVFVAVKWELATWVATRFFVPILLVGLTIMSTIWSLSPNETLRGSIQFLLIWVLGLGFALKYDGADFATYCGVTSALSIAFQIFIQIFANNGGNIGFEYAELALSIVAASWAMKTNGKYSVIWGGFALFGSIIAIYANDQASFGAAIGLLMALTIEIILRIVKSKALQMAWLFVVVLAGAVIFIMIKGQLASFAISELLDNLGSRSLFGIGFGTFDGALFNEFGQGLGLFGLGVAVCLMIFGLYFSIFPPNSKSSSLYPAFGICGLIIAAPNQVQFDSGIAIILCYAFYSNFCAENVRPKRKPIRKK